jgi:hypothetical protein
MDNDKHSTQGVRAKGDEPGFTLGVGVFDREGEGVSQGLLSVGKADLVLVEVRLRLDWIELDVHSAQYAYVMHIVKAERWSSTAGSPLPKVARQQELRRAQTDKLHTLVDQNRAEVVHMVGVGLVMTTSLKAPKKPWALDYAIAVKQVLLHGRPPARMPSFNGGANLLRALRW